MNLIIQDSKKISTGCRDAYRPTKRSFGSLSVTYALYYPRKICRAGSERYRFPQKKYVIYFTLADQSNYRITLDHVV